MSRLPSSELLPSLVGGLRPPASQAGDSQKAREENPEGGALPQRVQIKGPKQRRTWAERRGCAQLLAVSSLGNTHCLALAQVRGMDEGPVMPPESFLYKPRLTVAAPVASYIQAELCLPPWRFQAVSFKHVYV